MTESFNNQRPYDVVDKINSRRKNAITRQFYQTEREEFREPYLAVIALTVVKKGDKDIPGVIDEKKPRRRGPKRANNIRKMFGLTKAENVRKFVVKREVVKGDKTFVKRPKIQRLITDRRLRRKAVVENIRKERTAASKVAKEAYEKLVHKLVAEKKEEEKKKHAEAAKVKAAKAKDAKAKDAKK